MIEKTIKDYYQAVSEKFILISPQDIKKILNYGWRSLYLHNSYGGDVLLHNKDLWVFFGKVRGYDSIKFFKYYIRKLAIKLRVINKRKKIPWDGYYYFALTDKQYQNYLDQHNARGRKRKKFCYGNQILYKLYDECYIREYNRKYIFRVPLLIQMGGSIYYPQFTTNKAELIDILPIRKFKDILTSNHDYETLK